MLKAWVAVHLRMVKPISCLGISLLWSLCFQALGQAFRYQQITMRQGLPSDYVSAIFFDSSGMMWVGTDKGVCRYELGRPVTATTSQGLLNNMVYSIAEDDLRQVWVACGKGVARMKYQGHALLVDTVVQPKMKVVKLQWNANKGWWITSINEQGDQYTLWHCRSMLQAWMPVCRMKRPYQVVPAEGHIVYDPHDAPEWLSQQLPLQPFPVQGTGKSIGMFVGHGQVGLTTADSVFVYRHKPWQKQYAQALPPGSNISRSSVLYLGSQWHTLYRGHLGAQLYTPDGRFSHWVGQQGKGKEIFVFCMGEDAFGNIYLSDFGNGITVVGGQYLRQYDMPAKVQRIVVSTGRVYAYSQKGIYYIDTLHPPQLQAQFAPDAFIQHVPQAAGNKFWAVAPKKIRYPSGLISNLPDPAFDDLSDLAASGDSLWVSSYSFGLFVVGQGGKPRRLLWPELAAFGSINRLKLIGHELYLLSLSKGLMKLNLQTGERHWYTMADGLPSLAVYDVLKQADTLLVAAEGGVAICTPGGATQLGPAQGMRGTQALAVFADAGGRKWVLTNAGLHALQQTQLLPLRSHPLVFDDGAYITAAAYNAANDVLWVGTNQNVQAVLMHAVHPSAGTPPLAIGQVWCGQQQIGAGEKTILLAAQHEPLHIQLRNPYYSLYHQPEAFYKLNGYDATWQPLPAKGTMSFTRLPPGTYHLELKAVGPDAGEWTNSHVLQITVRAPFYRQGWFLAGAALLLAGTGFWWWRRRTNQLYQRRMQALQQENALQQERSRISRELHDNVGSMLALMINKLEDNDDANQRGKPVADLARHTLGQLRQTIWALDTHEITMFEWQRRASEFLMALRQDYPGLQMHFDTSGSPYMLSPIQALHLFRIMQEACTNAIKYSQAQTISVSTSCNNDAWLLQIADAGKGFEMSSVKMGYGLRNMRKRAEELNATLLITSAPGEGTLVQVALPLAMMNTPKG